MSGNYAEINGINYLGSGNHAFLISIKLLFAN